MGLRSFWAKLYSPIDINREVAEEILNETNKISNRRSWRSKIKDVALKVSRKAKYVALTIGTLGIYANNRGYDEWALRWKEFLIERGYDEEVLRTNYHIFQAAKRYIEENNEEYFSHF
jgi:hypothetical protein